MLHEVYQGASADRLAELWSTITKYSKVIVEACQTIAKVLRAAALVIEGAKTASIVQLASIQASFAAASSTGPWSSAAVLRLGRELMNQLLSQAVSRLGHTLLQPIEDMIFKTAQQIVPTPSNNSNGQGFNIDLAQLATCAADLRRGADDIESHGMDFRRIVSGLKLGEGSDPFAKLAIQVAEKILQTIVEDVLKRILGSFRDTAGKMDKLAGNLNENEDSNRMTLNGIASTVANPFSPNSAVGTGLNSVGSTGTGRSADAGLGAFAALMPKLGPVGSGSSRSGSGGNGIDTLGLKSPNLGSLGGSGGGHGGGGGGGGGSESGGSGGVGGGAGFATRLATPGGSGSKNGSMRLGTSLEGDHSGTGSASGGGGGGGTGTSTAGVGARPMGGGMMGMGGMHMGGGYGPVGGSGIRGAQRRGGGPTGGGNGSGNNGENGETNPADGVIADPNAAAGYAAMQLGRVTPVRRDPATERDDRYDGEFDDDFDADLSDLPEFTEFSDPA
ncbi:hypothetical protein [Kitasatospora cheerisanensis]|uniref:Uncharacterized protein n=1 Tax=Kitasatospora cheerisanensis KCTC 2395 TaxID=1348663 RepID=A0A066Z0A7_9ACTN|nr:hypothetical protein [Kitasatospora cheerisanensis]KDN87188.1 hypothetical protein KCH_12730 [Kitasatospora cheerisanensis KCTC 2395]